MSAWQPTIAAIIPAYNEESTIGPIVQTLVASGRFREVIVISDGSLDHTAAVARAHGASFVHELSLNTGKGAAMIYGVSRTDAEVICFFDADLSGLTMKHIDQLLEPIVRRERVMNVGIRDRGALVMALCAHLPLIGGERAMLRRIFDGVPEKYLQGYMVESALNYFCRSHHFPYGSVGLIGLHIRHKFEKMPLGRALREYLKMDWQIVRAMVTVRLAKWNGEF